MSTGCGWSGNLFHENKPQRGNLASADLASLGLSSTATPGKIPAGQVERAVDQDYFFPAIRVARSSFSWTMRLLSFNCALVAW